MKGTFAILIVLLGTPAVAHAGGPTMVSREVPLGSRVLQSSGAPASFDMVGLHWRGSGTVSFRTHSIGGGWSRWRAARPEAEDLPDPRSPERRLVGWKLGNPWWTGSSDRIEYRTVGQVSRLRAYFITSPSKSPPSRVPAGSETPPILPRLGWQANEQIVRANPEYALRLDYAVVHHTAGASSYTRSQSAAIVRGIQLYHVKGNGWNDIGYNFLVDRFGQVFEGRAGGIDRNVVGAHAEGFNTGSVGVAVIGTYDSRTITAATQAALVRLLSWRLDVAHVDPLAFGSTLSGGNARFQADAPVRLRAISGHRDTGYTKCPGDVLYAQLPAIAAAVARTGLPKIYEPRIGEGFEGAYRITARLSSLLAWTVTVRDALGGIVASRKGTGSKVDWTLPALPASGGAYSWAIETAGARPAAGTFRGKGTARHCSQLSEQRRR